MISSPLSLSRRSRSYVAVFCLCLLASGGSVWAQASSSAHIVVDAASRKILSARNADEKLPVASLTKVVTACVVIDWLDANQIDRNLLIPIPPSAASLGGANALGLQPGDQISIRDALSCALMASDNLCAQALAEHFGTEMWRAKQVKARSGYDFFISQMNALARAQGMTRTEFFNPHGLDHERPRGYSSAADMAKITIYALDKPSFNFTVSQQTRDIAFVRGSEKKSFRIFNTNRLLGQQDINGVKTGRTTRAGDCLIVSAQRQDKIQMIDGNRYIRTPYHLVVVTLNSSDRFGQALGLLNQGWVDYEGWVAGGMQAVKGDMLGGPTP